MVLVLKGMQLQGGEIEFHILNCDQSCPSTAAVKTILKQTFNAVSFVIVIHCKFCVSCLFFFNMSASKIISFLENPSDSNTCEPATLNDTGPFHPQLTIFNAMLITTTIWMCPRSRRAPNVRSDNAAKPHSS